MSRRLKIVVCGVLILSFFMLTACSESGRTNAEDTDETVSTTKITITTKPVTTAQTTKEETTEKETTKEETTVEVTTTEEEKPFSDDT